MRLALWSERAARWSRQLAAMGLLLLVVRGTWLVSGEAIAGAAQGARNHARGEAGAQEGSADGGPQSPHQELIGTLKGEAKVSSKSAEEEVERPALRRLVVDFGPERADVYVRGSRVGQVPYVGQILCMKDELVKVQVLPPSGAPISRQVRCQSVAKKEE